MSGSAAAGDGWCLSQAQAQGARERQEDALRIATLGEGAAAWRLALVCDGMGGHEGGKLAANLAADGFVAALREAAVPTGGAGAMAVLEQALARTVAILVGQIAAGAPAGMGTTLTALLLRGRSLAWLSVGDSLLLHRRGRQLKRLNADHSMVPVLDGLVASGRISREEAAADPRRSALRSVLGGEKPALCDCQFRADLLSPGDDLLLASDGLSTLDDEAILSALEGDATAACLVDGVIAAGRPHQDNASLILLRGAHLSPAPRPAWWRRLLSR